MISFLNDKKLEGTVDLKSLLIKITPIESSGFTMVTGCRVSHLFYVYEAKSSCHRPCNAGTTVPIKYSNSFVPGQFIGDCFETPGAAGIGLEIETAKRHYVVH